MTTTRQYQVSRLEAAYIIAQETGNIKLVKALEPLVLRERARSVKSTAPTSVGEAIVNASVNTGRPVYNPRRASIKLKSELYDTRIELESPEEIEAKRQAYIQRRRVFQRG